MNAIDALPQGGHIYFDIVETADPFGVEINIRDTGVGMAPEAFEHLFDPFYTTKDDGLGLGLFICRKIIDDHEGRLSVESQPGVGTEISIWLPKIEPNQEEGH
jgi:signal transduction histidine kinase